jgi:DNA-binding NarL/FixJ family response regulator
MLRRQLGIAIVAETSGGLQAIEVCLRIRPDLLIMDLVLPELGGIEVLRRLRNVWPKLRVLIYSGDALQSTFLAALRSRPQGFVQKSDSLETLQEALRIVMDGGSYLTPFITNLLDVSLPDELRGLTAREREVVQMVAEGRSSKEIAGLLGIAPRTVEHHRVHVRHKLGLRDVASLTRFAIRAGLIAG